jgi:predicted GNAT superfamily acetyltransferase
MASGARAVSGRIAPVTEGADEPAGHHRLADAALAAAVTAGVTVRDLEAGEMTEASALLAQVWRTGPRESPMEPGLLVALGFAGNYVSGAFDADGTMVGACAGFLGAPLGGLLHSHVAAVRPGGPHGTGTALKLHQRAWCAARGIGVIAWTYDPLIARNAWFNLGRLGAHVEAYLIDFYGKMDDGLNAGEESDRLLVHWPVEPEEVLPPEEPASAYAALVAGADGSPLATPEVPPGAETVTLAVPHDVEALRASDEAGERAAASRWRATFREVYAGLHEQGWRVRGFVKTGHYVLHRPDQTETP